MAQNGIARKLVVVAAALGAILLVLRVVGGRGGDGVDEDAIDRVDTGRSDEDEVEGGTVDTGLERVSTADADGTDDADDPTGAPESLETTETTGTAERTETTEAAGPTTEVGESGETAVGTDVGNPGSDDESEGVSPVSTAGRFDDLDVFDIISIASAGVDAARDEYRSRT